MATKYSLTKRVATEIPGVSRDGAGHEITAEELKEYEVISDFQGAMDLEDGVDFAKVEDAEGNQYHVYRWEE